MFSKLKHFFYVLLIIIFILTGCTKAYPPVNQEKSNSQVPSNSQNISFIHLNMITESNGWALGQQKVYRTMNGGTTWEDVTPIGTDKIYAWYFLDSDTAWILSLNGILYRTEDGGKNWVREEVPFNLGILFFMPDKNFYQGWVLKDYGPASGNGPVDVYKLINGKWLLIHKGEKPDNPTANPGKLPYAGRKNGFVFLPDAKTGFVTIEYREPGKYGLYITKNGGYIWTQKTLPISLEYKDCAIFVNPPKFFNNGKGILPVWFQNLKKGTYSVVFFLTHDKGNTWSGIIPFQTKERVVYINLADESHWWILTESKLYGTNDGGKSWTELDYPEDAVQVQFINSKIGWALINPDKGTALLYSNDGGQSWKKIF